LIQIDSIVDKKNLVVKEEAVEDAVEVMVEEAKLDHS
jgi:hypothetical protein